MAGLDQPYVLSSLGVGSSHAVFSDCAEGDHYLGYQLVYDAGDRNTEVGWDQTVELTLLKDGVVQWSRELTVDMLTQTFVSTVFHEETVRCTDKYYVFDWTVKAGVLRLLRVIYWWSKSSIA